jgi:PEP-CTERM motif
MKKFLCRSALAALLTALPLSSAFALSISTVGGDPLGYLAGTLVYDFESGSVPGAFSGDIVVLGSSISGKSAKPAFDTSSYFASVPFERSSGSATLDFGKYMNYFGLYWGSVDTYNSLKFYKDGSLVGTVNGIDVANPANGNQTLQSTNRYVNITDLLFDKVVFSSTSYAFEFDNIAASPVPEPATMLLFGAGLAGLATVRRKRK